MLEDDDIFCPVCQGDGMFLGSLGNLDHFRCRACGLTFSIENEPVMEDEDGNDWMLEQQELEDYEGLSGFADPDIERI